MGKYNKLYNILECDIDIPINDIDAWNKYPEYNYLYNKMELCKYQNIKSSPMPIIPDNYPVIIKPIINLYGMGLNIKKINNINQFNDNWLNNNFWMEYLDGEHLSYDLIILKGEIRKVFCFKGHKDDKVLGKFKYWESINIKLPNIVKRLVKDKLLNYSGVLNVETMSDKMIECHLRMGDIDLFPTFDILKGVIKTYKEENYDWEKIEYPKIYMCPYWYSEYPEKLYNFCKKNIEPLLENNINIHDYEIDNYTLASPCETSKRLLYIVVSNLEYAKMIFKSISDIINISY